MMNETENVDVHRAKELLVAGALLLDVREDSEWEAGHAPTAHHIPLASVPDHLEDLPRGRVIVAVCRSGGRSSRAAAFLREEGFDVANLEGGMTAWHEAGQPMVADDGDPVVT